MSGESCHKTGKPERPLGFLRFALAIRLLNTHGSCICKMGLKENYNKYDINESGSGKEGIRSALWMLSQAQHKDRAQATNGRLCSGLEWRATRMKPFVPSVGSGDYIGGGSGSCFPGWRHCSGNRLGCHGYSSPGPGPAHFQAARLSACLVPAVTGSLPVSWPPHTQHCSGMLGSSSFPDGL